MKARWRVAVLVTTAAAVTLAVCLAWPRGSSHESEQSSPMRASAPAGQAAGRGPSASVRQVDHSPTPRREPVRGAEEWQGMPTDEPRNVPFCDASGDCGLARACIDHRCVGCARDQDCQSAEACALEHCLPRENARCRYRRDCAPGEFCILSGYTPGDVRGNAEMRSGCVADTGHMPDELHGSIGPTYDDGVFAPKLAATVGTQERLLEEVRAAVRDDHAK
jgi:hypothetical protein